MEEEGTEKKGMSTGTIVLIILAIVGFVVIFGGVCVCAGLTTLGNNLQQSFEKVSQEMDKRNP